MATACPALLGPRGQPCSLVPPTIISAKNVDYLTFDTCDRNVGTLVTFGCHGIGRVPSSPSTVLCLTDGSWNGSVPICSEPSSGAPRVLSSSEVSLETLIIIGVVCGFAALVLLIIITLSLVYFIKIRKYNKNNRSLDLPETDFYSNPLGKATSRAGSRSNIYQSEISPIYSTRLWRRGYLDNVPTPDYYASSQRPYIAERRFDYMEEREQAHVHQRPSHAFNNDFSTAPPPPYRRAEETWSLSSDDYFDSPNRGSRPPINTLIYNSIRWDPKNMKWHDNFNYPRDGRLPRYHMDERGLYRGSWDFY